MGALVCISAWAAPWRVRVAVAGTSIAVTRSDVYPRGNGRRGPRPLHQLVLLDAPGATSIPLGDHELHRTLDPRHTNPGHVLEPTARPLQHGRPTHVLYLHFLLLLLHQDHF